MLDLDAVFPTPAFSLQCVLPDPLAAGFHCLCSARRVTDCSLAVPLCHACLPCAIRAAVLGRGDVTEKLLVDDSIEVEEEVGPLADLKRQMRMLSQGSPVVVAASVAAQLQQEQQQAAPGGQAEEEEEEGAEEMEDAPAAGEVAPASAGQLRRAAKTPRTAVSMGYADSHNPATLSLLRSGGTTQLLGREEAAEQQRLEEEADAEEREEQEAAAEQEMELAGEAGFEAGGITARTNGTTKLLADMTMASMVGAKLRGRAPQGELQLWGEGWSPAASAAHWCAMALGGATQELL